MKTVFCLFVLLFGSTFAVEPVSYKGRFRPSDAYAKQWLFETYHRDSIKNEHLEAFSLETPSAIDFLWKLHFAGHQPWDDAPLFWIRQAEVKKLLHLPLEANHFSYNELHHNLFDDKEINLSIMRSVLPVVYSQNFNSPTNRSGKSTLEMIPFAPGVWVAKQNGQLEIIEVSTNQPWHYLKPGMIISYEHAATNKSILDEIQSLQLALSQFEELQGNVLLAETEMEKAHIELKDQKVSSKEIALSLEQHHPLRLRLQKSGNLLKVLPGKIVPGEWYSLHALRSKVYNPMTKQLELAGNFTAYPDELFEKIRDRYFAWENGNTSAREELSELLQESYRFIEGTPFKEAMGKQLFYPRLGQIQAESSYLKYPLILLCIGLYSFALLLLMIGWLIDKNVLLNVGTFSVIAAFMVHTFLLGLRIYILGRPPVSNMFETILYVPWVSVLVGLLLRLKLKNPALLIASSFASVALLILLYMTHLDNALENVQAVLDSQYWLIIHVLMVVGSYGVFLLCSILGHFYLIGRAWFGKETPNLEFIARCVLQTMYIGVALLIPGTILGGIWAAESWGRFWDWDPKESWAFISICVYLIWIHAFRFHKIQNFGLAIGAVSGFLAISFTWYGVNYILGTGLHSYGFGQGGEWWYYGYVLGELLFLAGVTYGERKPIPYA